MGDLTWIPSRVSRNGTGSGATVLPSAKLMRILPTLTAREIIALFLTPLGTEDIIPKGKVFYGGWASSSAH